MLCTLRVLCAVFVAQDGSLKLGDLGLSRYFSSRTVQAMTTGGVGGQQRAGVRCQRFQSD